MFKWLTGLLDRAFSVIGALIFAQAPLFMQEYTQQLVGRTAELHMQVNAMRQAASLSNKSLEQLMQKFMENPDLDVVRQGEMMHALIGRWQQLSEALAAMQGSTLWGRPFAFLFHLNGDAFSSTFQHFRLGLPLNAEGGIYALLGMACGYLLFLGLKKAASFLKCQVQAFGVR
jgi:Protein of unknown function (DUF2937)